MDNATVASMQGTVGRTDAGSAQGIACQQMPLSFLKGGETALSLISYTLAACGLICDITDGSIHQIASIPQNLQSDMQWVVRCNGEVLDDPASFAVNSGDELVLSYE